MVRQFYDGYGEHFKKADGTELFCPPKKEEKCRKEEICIKNDSCDNKTNPFENIFSSLKADDIILIGVLIFLLYDGVDDYILLIIIGIIFLMGINDKNSLFDK